MVWNVLDRPITFPVSNVHTAASCGRLCIRLLAPETKDKNKKIKQDGMILSNGRPMRFAVTINEFI